MKFKQRSIEDTHLQIISQTLQNFTTNITVIDLSDNQIGNTGAFYLAQLLRINQVISYSDIYCVFSMNIF